MNAVKTTAIVTNVAGAVLLILAALVENGNISPNHKGLRASAPETAPVVQPEAVSVSGPVRSPDVAEPPVKIYQIEDLPLAPKSRGSALGKKPAKKLVPCGYRQVGFKSLGDPEHPEPRGVTLLCLR